MNQTTLIRGLLAFAAVLPVLDLAAKCPVGPVSASIKQSNGLTVSLLPMENYLDPELNMPYSTEVLAFGTIRLGPGDTLLMLIAGSTCGNQPGLDHNGSAVLNWTSQLGITMSSRLYRCTAAGSYIGGCCDESCSQVTFDIAPLGPTAGPVGLDLYATLGGALVSTTSSTMRTDLLTQGLLPMSEPYTSMGYNFVSGGGETITGTPNITTVDWVIVELRDALQPATVLVSKAALITKYGRVIAANTQGLLSLNVPPGYYHVAIRHRNHLGVMTASPILLNAGPTASYSFKSSGAGTYGTEAGQDVGSFKFLWPGNGKWTSGTQQIHYVGSNNDRDVVLARIGGTTPTATTAGYHHEDINLDGVVKYTGLNNDRDAILMTIGGSTPNAVRIEQVP